MSAAEISIPVIKRVSRNHDDDQYYFIVREVEKDMTVNLKDWFIQMLPPDDDNEEWRLVWQPRKPYKDRVDREHASLPRE